MDIKNKMSALAFHYENVLVHEYFDPEVVKKHSDWLEELLVHKSKILEEIKSNPLNTQACIILKHLDDGREIPRLLIVRAITIESKRDYMTKSDKLIAASSSAISNIMKQGGQPNLNEIAELLNHKDLRVRNAASSFLAEHGTVFSNERIPESINSALESREQYERIASKRKTFDPFILNFTEYMNDLIIFIATMQGDNQFDWIFEQAIDRGQSPKVASCLSKHLETLNHQKYTQKLIECICNPEVNDKQRIVALDLVKRLRSRELIDPLIDLMFNASIRTPRRHMEKCLSSIAVSWSERVDKVAEYLYSDNSIQQRYAIALLEREVRTDFNHAELENKKSKVLRLLEGLPDKYPNLSPETKNSLKRAQRVIYDTYSRL